MQYPRTSEGPAPPPFSITDVTVESDVPGDGSSRVGNGNQRDELTIKGNERPRIRRIHRECGDVRFIAGLHGAKGAAGAEGLDSEHEVVARRTARKVNARSPAFT